MTKTVHGKVYGKTIELDENLDISDGQEVVVEVKVVSPLLRKPGDGFRRTEGALADDQEWDAIMEEIHQARKQERRSEIPDLGKP